MSADRKRRRHPVWNFFRWLFFLLIVGFCAWKVIEAFATEHFARYWTAIAMPLIGLVLLSFWYVIFGRSRFGVRLKRFGGFVFALVVLGILSIILFRYEGSVGGSSVPKFAFRWAPKPIELAPELPEIGESAEAAPVAEGVVDFLQFYGPNRDAMLPESSVTGSLDWATNPPEELWRQPIGIGWSGFAVAGNRAITQEQRGGEELVTCYDLLTGELLWAHGDETGFYLVAAAEENKVKEMAGDGPRAVPTIHDGKVYTYGATGVLNCLDLETGELVWTRNVLEVHEGKLPKWGKSTSPLIIEDLGLVVVSAMEDYSGDKTNVPTLVAYRMEDGEPAWVYEGAGASYSSPTLLELHGLRQIVSVNGHDVTGHDPETGEALWHFGWKGSFPKVAQPIPLPDNRLLVTASYGVGSHLLQINHQDGEWSAESLWRSLRLKTKFSTAAVRGGHAYLLDEGTLACVDLENAKRVWKEGKYGFGQHLLIGDQLLIQAEDGSLAMVKASPEGFEELARIDALNSMTWNPPTLAGRYLLVRNDKEAICFKLAATESSDPDSQPESDPPSESESDPPSEPESKPATEPAPEQESKPKP